MEHWGYWLNEPIFTDKGIYGIMKRKHAIYMFCQDGLLPFLKRHGYSLRLFDGQFFRVMLKLLYKLYQGHKVIPLPTECDNYHEQYTLFLESFDTDTMSDFWSLWGSIQDFDKDGYAYCLQFELLNFIWSWVNFETSPKALELYKEIDQDEYYEELNKGKDDPYLQETAKRDYQDRHW